MMYNMQMLLHFYNTTMLYGVEYIVATFNINTQREIHIICIYKIHSCLTSMLLKTLEALIKKSPNHYLELLF
jgi:hypothetical protein